MIILEPPVDLPVSLLDEVGGYTTICMGLSLTRRTYLVLFLW